VAKTRHGFLQECWIAQVAHAQKALAGAKSDSLLARNLASHFWGSEGEKLSEMISKTTVAKETKP